jgi:hypothetical protein
MTHLDGDEIGAYLKLEPIPLLVVADLDNVPLARLLLEKGVKVQYIDRDRWAVWGTGKLGPLHAAWSAEIVQLLLDHNADPELHGDVGYIECVCRCTGMPSAKTSLPCGRFWSTAQK